jgi:DNA invertase Pin-like site-specific DNA recombinase
MTTNEKQKTDAIVYNRVSTPGQVEHGYSLESQERDNREFAIRHGFTVIKSFHEKGESAKTQERTELKKLIKYCVENKNRIGALIVWKLDRLTRQLEDQISLAKQFDKLGIRVLVTTQTNLESSEGKLMRNIIGSFSQYENDIKSERTKFGMKAALLSGRWVWPPTTGYKSIRTDSQKPICIPDEEAPFMVRCFELFISGNYRQSDIVKQLHSEGFKRLTKTHLAKILRNPFYAGIVRHKWLDHDVAGLHTPLIAEETYFKAQELLDGKRPNKLKRLRQREDFPLKGFLFCHKCGRKLTAGWSKGRHGVKYGYYHCPTKGCSVNLRKETLETIFPAHLQSIQPKREFIALFEAILLDTWKSRQAAQLEEKRHLEREIKGLEEKITHFDDLLGKGLELEHYNRNIQQVKNNIMAKKVSLLDLKVDESDFSECIKYCKFFLANTAKLWEEGNLTQRQRFQNLIFPAGITFEGETIRTKETALIFSHFQAKTKAEYTVVALKLLGLNQILEEIRNIYSFRELVPLRYMPKDRITRVSA